MSQRSLFESGPEPSISSPAVSPVPTSPLRGKAPDSPASSPASGARCSGLSEESRRLGSSLRTFLRFALAGRSRWSLIWRRAAIPSCHLSWWVLGRQGLRTEETESGSSPAAWGTPRVATHGGHGRARSDEKARLEDQVHEEWATPRSSDAERGRDGRRGPESQRQGGPCLMEQLLEWPTPTATTYGSSNNGDPGDGRGAYAKAGKPSLEGCAREEWPTPMARDWRSTQASPQTHAKNARPLSEVVGLDGQPDAESASTPGSPREWCTPTRRDDKGPGPEHTKGGRDLAKDAAGKLNPDWVEALMGAPPGWTDLPDETVSALWATRTRRTSRS